MEDRERDVLRKMVAEEDKRFVHRYDFLDPEIAGQIRARAVLIQALEKAGLSINHSTLAGFCAWRLCPDFACYGNGKYFAGANFGISPWQRWWRRRQSVPECRSLT